MLSIIIWTTTPWTIPANKALAYNQNFKIFSYRIDKKKIVVAEKLINSVIENCSLGKFKILKSFKGKDFKKQFVLIHLKI